MISLIGKSSWIEAEFGDHEGYRLTTVVLVSGSDGGRYSVYAVDPVFVSGNETIDTVLLNGGKKLTVIVSSVPLRSDILVIEGEVR